ncbi:hypothetical protein C8R44DRAFT_874011 [Mycena epipterygia]|nr:hypothetical protein C8R44DRAFT_874011 [Mycena epipterygia]
MPILPNDPLAAQLNDLAIANSDGLLNDDEYRLLRQNLFERYSGGVEILSISPPAAVKLVSGPPRRKHVELVEQPPPRAQVTAPARSKTSGVAGFLRRATGRRSVSPSPGPTNVIKLSLIPRMFSKKAEDTSSSDTDSSGTRHSSSPSFSRKASIGDLASPTRTKGFPPTSPTRPKAEPTSPIRSKFEVAPASTSRSAFAISAQSKYDVIPGASNDIFDDDNLQTAEVIRNAIAAVEEEGRRLVMAFNDLETSAVIRYRQEHQRQRSGSSTPSTGLRRPTIAPLPGSSPGSTQTTTPRSRSNSQRQNTDSQSVLSGSSLRTSKSTASLFPNASPPPTFSQSTPPPTSAWSALSPRRLRRKGSVSSISSQGTSSFLGVAPPTSLRRSASMSRSTSHLPLPVPVSPGSGSTMMELLNHTPPGEGGEELVEVRRRRAEMMGRCEARLEYLRAKLKGAEIREKLLKK